MYKCRIGVIDSQKLSLSIFLSVLKSYNNSKYIIIPIEEKNIDGDFVNFEEVDVVILDIRDPNTLNISKKLHPKSSVPIIGMLPETNSSEVLKCIWGGIDGFILEYDTPNTIMEKLKVIMNRNSIIRNIIINSLHWDLDKLEVKYNNQIINFSPKELVLLGILLSNPNNCFTREELLLLLWGDKEFTNKKVVDTTIKNIRKKFKNSFFPIDDHLITVRRFGYKWSHSLK
jgi:DNA-binding response OmpR family regulator